MPYTAFKKLSVQTATSNAGVWGAGGTTGDDLNTGVMGPVDTMLAGISSFSVASSNVSLSFAAGGGGDVQNAAWRFTGTLTANITVSPAVGDATTYFNGFYYWENLTSGSFSITVTTGAGSVALPQGRRGVLFVDATNGPRIFAICGSSTADPVPAGTVMLFYQNAAPSGWTIVSALNDYALKVVSSSGGVTSGSVPYSTLFGRTATDSTILTTAQIPLHGHPFRTSNTGSAGSAPNGSGGMIMATLGTVQNQTFTGTPSNTVGEQIGGSGGGEGHTHDIDMRVNTLAVIMAMRN